MLKDYKNKKLILIIIGLVFIAIAVALFYFFFLKIKLAPEPAIKPTTEATEEYSYKNVIYNFWGVVKEKQGDIVFVQGITPKTKISETEPNIQTIKFKITQQTEIVKRDEQGNQIFASLESIQLEDNLGIKADQIDTIKKEAIATDILILSALPELNF